MLTYLQLQRNIDQNTYVLMPKTSYNTREHSSRTAQKASPVLPRTEPRDKTLGPMGYLSATVLIKQLWIIFRQDCDIQAVRMLDKTSSMSLDNPLLKASSFLPPRD